MESIVLRQVCCATFYSSRGNWPELRPMYPRNEADMRIAVNKKAAGRISPGGFWSCKSADQ
ncbi:hypothetical protein ACIPF8_16345 [Collimonas sp. NPDC087041]|uniref:hypothetical protein n=1 Tax=Collimonas sp. NPDC087041 TaxID=3363960 RepID=UPI00382EC2A2